jgi:hypothetical protein
MASSAGVMPDTVLLSMQGDARHGKGKLCGI